MCIYCNRIFLSKTAIDLHVESEHKEKLNAEEGKLFFYFLWILCFSGAFCTFLLEPNVLCRPLIIIFSGGELRWGGGVESTAPPLPFFKFKSFFFGWNTFFRRKEIPFPKIVINLSWTYIKLCCKGEPNWFSG